MQRFIRKGRGCVWALVGVAILIALVPWQGVIWDGAFPNVECRFTFVDAAGKPVPGVELTVFTKAGGKSPFYPVDEFVPDRAFVSDAEGRMTFHHSAKFLEFSGHAHSNLFGMWFGTTTAPKYTCVFTHGGREVFRTPFNFHRSEWEPYRQPDFKRLRQPPWDRTRHWRQPEEERSAWRLRMFDGNGDGKLDREEATACGYFEWMLGDETVIEKPVTCSYWVVERTITVPD